MKRLLKKTTDIEKFKRDRDQHLAELDKIYMPRSNDILRTLALEIYNKGYSQGRTDLFEEIEMQAKKAFNPKES